ncbi:MAG: alpha/beta fold hydrolase, partial [Clostridia bacterium]|nr:alpha/beta fold hydrolase [Clostridia bacterium]
LLYGAIYETKSVNSKDEVVVFVHGMGPGHCAYMTEIAYFCNHGYNVIAVDSLGCGGSQGKNMHGMFEGVQSAVATIDFAKKQFAGKKIYLIGHSWGGYSSLCASKLRKVDKVVAISAPSSPSRTIQGGAAPIMGKALASILRPFWWCINLFKFGAKGNMNAAKSAERNDTPTLLIHGDNDGIVSKKNEAFYKANGGNIEKYLAKGKAHNPYNTVEAEKKLAELSYNLSQSSKMTEEERQAYFTNFDYAAATEEDNEVMGKILSFLEE